MSEKEHRASIVALPREFGVSHFGPTTSLRTQEFLRTNMQWEQFSQSHIQHIVDEVVWRPVLSWLADHPYALFVDDRANRKQGIRRKRADIQEELKFNSRTWVGPDRYDTDKAMSSQQAVAENEGVNCQVAVHLVAEFLQKYIKERTDRSEELFTKHLLYRPIDFQQDELEVGDILFFHEKVQVSTAKALHLATMVGRDIGGMPWILHATAQYFNRPAVEIIPITAIFSNKQSNIYGGRSLSTIEHATFSVHESRPSQSCEPGVV